MNIKRLYEATDFSIGQLYLYKKYSELKRGYCVKIEQDCVTFQDKDSSEYEKVFYLSWCYPKKEYNYFAEYNANLFSKYKQLIKIQEQERKELLYSNVYLKEKCNKNSIWSRFKK